MKGTFLVVSLFLVLANSSARACEQCGCFVPQIDNTTADDQVPFLQWTKAGWYAAMAEQFTHFGTLQLDGHEVSNPTGQYENSSITQLVAGYSPISRVSFQLNIPLIYREFKRPEGFNIDHGTESGLGDVSLLMRVMAYRYVSPGRRDFDFKDKNPLVTQEAPAFSVTLNLLAGLKFPTGGTSRLTEEFHEVEVPGAPPSAIHGHDLTLGTGSYDGLFGGQVSLRYRNVFFESDALFTLRGDGAHDYHYANEVSARGGPGYYFVNNKRGTIALQAVVSGEEKAEDRFRGSIAEDTAISSVLVGPRILASLGRWSAEVAVDIPVWTDNSALQAVADYRIRGGISCHF